MPDVEHLLHAGSVESQTKQSRRHSQQWRFWYPSILCVSYLGGFGDPFLNALEYSGS
jgi:hypothetical protein